MRVLWFRRRDILTYIPRLSVVANRTRFSRTTSTQLETRRHPGLKVYVQKEKRLLIFLYSPRRGDRQNRAHKKKSSQSS